MFKKKNRFTAVSVRMCPKVRSRDGSKLKHEPICRGSSARNQNCRISGAALFCCGYPFLSTHAQDTTSQFGWKHPSERRFDGFYILCTLNTSPASPAGRETASGHKDQKNLYRLIGGRQPEHFQVESLRVDSPGWLGLFD